MYVIYPHCGVTEYAKVGQHLGVQQKRSEYNMIVNRVTQDCPNNTSRYIRKRRIGNIFDISFLRCRSFLALSSTELSF